MLEEIDLLIDATVLPLPFRKGRIVLDGQCSGAAWKSAACVEQWKSYDKLLYGTEALLTWDKDRLYVGYICEEPSPEKLRYGQTNGIRSRNNVPILNMNYHRPQFCEDDTVEVFIDAKNDSFSYSHVLLNPHGDLFSSRGWASRTKLESDYNWRPAKLQYSSSIGKSQWSATMSIPFASLGLKNVVPGQVMGLNLKRERQAGDQMESYYWQTETLAWSTQLSTTLVYQPEMFNKVILGSFTDNLRYFSSSIEKSYACSEEDKKELAAIVSSNPKREKEWRQQLRKMRNLLEHLYSSSFTHKWWVYSKEPDFGQMKVGVVDIPKCPAPGVSLPKTLETVFLPIQSSQVSLWVMNLGRRAVVPKVELRSRDIFFKPIERFSVKKMGCGRLDFKVEPGEYEVMIDGACGTKLMVKQLEALPVVKKKFNPPRRQTINGRDFWYLQRMDWNLPGVCKLPFLEDSGLFSVIPGYTKSYRVAVRQIDVYEPKSQQSISGWAAASCSFDCSDVQIVYDEGREEALLSENSSTPLSGWIQLDFDNVYRISKIEIDHGEIFRKSMNGRKVNCLNVADSFELQYRLGQKWKTIPGSSETGNRKFKTVHEFDPVVTIALRLVIHSQSYSGIEYDKKDAWQWFFEGPDNYLLNYRSNRLNSDNTLSQAGRESSLECQLDAAPFSLHAYRFARADEVDAKKDPMFEMALNSLKRRFPKTFLGFWIAEWDSDQLNTLHGLFECTKWKSNAGMIPQIPKDRHNAVALMKEWYDLEQSAHLGEGFGMNCYRCADHLHLAWGSKSGWVETTQSGNTAHRVQFAFLRGACRQFSKPMGLYAAVYLGPSSPDHLNPRKAAVDYTPAGGTSPSLYWRTLVYGYLSGVDLMSSESQVQGHLIQNRTGYELSPHGKALARFYQLTQRIEDRGAAYTPIGILLPFEHGWYPAYMTGNSTGVAAGRVVGNGEPYGPADEMVDAFFRTVFGGWTTQRRERHGHAFSHSTFGDLFDVLVIDPPKGAPSVSFLSRYPALILLGDYTFEPNHIKKLVNYVRQGGLLIINKAHKKHFPQHENIMTVGPEWFGAKGGRMNSEAVQFLQKLSCDLSPVTVTGDIHYLINKTKQGLVIGLFNHKGVYKMPKESEVVFPEESSCVEVKWDGLFDVLELVEGGYSETSCAGLELMVPPGEVRVLVLTSIMI